MDSGEKMEKPEKAVEGDFPDYPYYLESRRGKDEGEGTEVNPTKMM
ncbi:MAG: hypothetical protein L0Z62_40725 [Gemmataceae bacterium]|nr:hypothetical protein [Gemmataceae bacterium]